MNKIIWIVIILAVIMIALLGVLVLVPRNFDQGQNPLTGTDGLAIYSLRPNQEISSPLKITGSVNGGGWSGFEGQVGTVKLLDSKGNQLGETAILTATTEWTALPTSFEANLNFVSAEAQNGTLVFYNENPSGDPARDKTFSLPVKIKASGETMVIKAYFTKDNGTGNQDCSAVLALDRIVPKTTTVARAALDELLKGPTSTEKNAGFFTSIPAGSKLNSISIVNGEVRADFNEATESGGGSCSMAARVAQIRETLMQFPTITSIKLSIDGRTGDIFQP